MEEMALSRFKATCLAALDRVGKIGKPLRITPFGKPVAEIVPPSSGTRGKSWLGAMKGTGQILGDVVTPATDEHEWDAIGG